MSAISECDLVVGNYSFSLGNLHLGRRTGRVGAVGVAAFALGAVAFNTCPGTFHAAGGFATHSLVASGIAVARLAVGACGCIPATVEHGATRFGKHCLPFGRHSLILVHQFGAGGVGVAVGLDGEHNGFGNKQADNDSYPCIADAFQTLHPCVVIPSYGLHHRPEAVGHMEPQGDETDEVDREGPPLTEGDFEEPGSGSSGNAFTRNGVNHVELADFGKLHLSPELDEVNHHERYDNDAENEHVFRRPFNLLGARGHGIALNTAGFAVLKREPGGENDVEHNTCCKHQGADKRIPVCPEELTNHIVSRRPKHSHSVHQCVKRHE